MSMSLMSANRFIYYWMPVIAWMGVILLLSGFTAARVGEVRESLSPPVPSFATSSLFVHPVEFGVLAVLLYRLLDAYTLLAPRYVAAFSLLIAVGFGFLDESRQAFVLGRRFDLADIGLDALGAALGVAAALAVRRLVFDTGRGVERGRAL